MQEKVQPAWQVEEAHGEEERLRESLRQVWKRIRHAWKAEAAHENAQTMRRPQM